MFAGLNMWDTFNKIKKNPRTLLLMHLYFQGEMAKFCPTELRTTKVNVNEGAVGVILIAPSMK